MKFLLKKLIVIISVVSMSLSTITMPTIIAATVEDSVVGQYVMIAQAAELKELIEECEKNNISCDYELAAWKTIDRFASYVEEDIKNSEYFSSKFLTLFEHTIHFILAYIICIH